MTIEIFQEDGSIAVYAMLSERLPKFLAKFPPSEYGVVRTRTPVLETMPSLMALLTEIVKQGKKPEDFGLPMPTRSITKFIFEAKLIDKEGRVIAVGTACKEILAYKDWEIGETSSLQRLLAAVGFGGDVLDGDERMDMRDQGLHTQEHSEPQSPTTTEPKPEGQQGIPQQLLRQIENLAKKKGEKVPQPKSVEEAKAELNRLLAA